MSLYIPSVTLSAMVAGVAVAATLLGCGDERPPSGGSGTQTTATTTTTTTGNGGNGAEGGMGGAGGGGGSAGSGPIGPADNACVGDFAFRAAGMSFTPATPPDLGAALNELTYDTMEHPITIVLQSTDPASATMGGSPSLPLGDGMPEAFDSGYEPTFTGATILQGSFSTASPQPTGYLRVRHQQGAVYLQLDNLTFIASTSFDCSQAFVSLDAVIPAAERTKQLTISSGPTTIGTLAGGNANDSIQLRAIFLSESINFDHSTL
jgi:hypothetical protein